MSRTVSVEEVATALEEDGFYCIPDPTLGSRIAETEGNGFGFSISSEQGLGVLQP